MLAVLQSIEKVEVCAVSNDQQMAGMERLSADCVLALDNIGKLGQNTVQEADAIAAHAQELRHAVGSIDSECSSLAFVAQNLSHTRDEVRVTSDTLKEIAGKFMVDSEERRVWRDRRAA